jgi:hypothetical protein
MKRYVSLALAVAVLVPFVASGADAATKKKKTNNGTQVFGFVQTAPVIGGTIKNRNAYGERQYLTYRDNTQKFFARFEHNSPGR